MKQETKQQIKWTLMALGCFISSGFLIGGYFYISFIKVGSFFNWSLFYGIVGVIAMVIGIDYTHKLDNWVGNKDVKRKK